MSALSRGRSAPILLTLCSLIVAVSPTEPDCTSLSRQCCWRATDDSRQWQRHESIDPNWYRKTFPAGAFREPPGQTYYSTILSSTEEHSTLQSCELCSKTGTVKLWIRHWASAATSIQLCWRQNTGLRNATECRDLDAARHGKIDAQQVSVLRQIPVTFTLVLRSRDSLIAATALIDFLNVRAEPCSLNIQRIATARVVSVAAQKHLAVATSPIPTLRSVGPSEAMSHKIAELKRLELKKPSIRSNPEETTPEFSEQNDSEIITAETPTDFIATTTPIFRREIIEEISGTKIERDDSQSVPKSPSHWKFAQIQNFLSPKIARIADAIADATTRSVSRASSELVDRDVVAATESVGLRDEAVSAESPLRSEKELTPNGESGSPPAFSPKDFVADAAAAARDSPTWQWNGGATNREDGDLIEVDRIAQWAARSGIRRTATRVTERTPSEVDGDTDAQIAAQTDEKPRHSPTPPVSAPIWKPEFGPQPPPPTQIGTVRRTAARNHLNTPDTRFQLGRLGDFPADSPFTQTHHTFSQSPQQSFHQNPQQFQHSSAPQPPQFINNPAYVPTREDSPISDNWPPAPLSFAAIANPFALLGPQPNYGNQRSQYSQNIQRFGNQQFVGTQQQIGGNPQFGNQRQFVGNPQTFRGNPPFPQTPQPTFPPQSPSPTFVTPVALSVDPIAQPVPNESSVPSAPIAPIDFGAFGGGNLAPPFPVGPDRNPTLSSGFQNGRPPAVGPPSASPWSARRPAPTAEPFDGGLASGAPGSPVGPPGDSTSALLAEAFGELNPFAGSHVTISDAAAGGKVIADHSVQKNATKSEKTSKPKPETRAETPMRESHKIPKPQNTRTVETAIAIDEMKSQQLTQSPPTRTNTTEWKSPSPVLPSGPIQPPPTSSLPSLNPFADMFGEEFAAFLEPNFNASKYEAMEESTTTGQPIQRHPLKIRPVSNPSPNQKGSGIVTANRQNSTTPLPRSHDSNGHSFAVRKQSDRIAATASPRFLDSKTRDYVSQLRNGTHRNETLNDRVANRFAIITENPRNLTAMEMSTIDPTAAVFPLGFKKQSTANSAELIPNSSEVTTTTAHSSTTSAAVATTSTIPKYRPPQVSLRNEYLRRGQILRRLMHPDVAKGRTIAPIETPPSPPFHKPATLKHLKLLKTPKKCPITGECSFERDMCTFTTSKQLSSRGAHFKRVAVGASNFMEARIGSGAVAVVDSPTNTTSSLRLTFDYLSWSSGGRLSACCAVAAPHPTELRCPFEPLSDETNEAVIWKEAYIRCDPGTNRIVFICENFTDKVGVCAVDNVRMVIDEGVDSGELCESEA